MVNLRDNIKQFNFKPAFNEQKRASIQITKPQTLSITQTSQKVLNLNDSKSKLQTSQTKKVIKKATQSGIVTPGQTQPKKLVII